MRLSTGQAVAKAGALGYAAGEEPDSATGATPRNGVGTPTSRLNGRRAAWWRRSSSELVLEVAVSSVGAAKLAWRAGAAPPVRLEMRVGGANPGARLAATRTTL